MRGLPIRQAGCYYSRMVKKAIVLAVAAFGLATFFLPSCSPCTFWAQPSQMLFADGRPHRMHTGFFFSFIAPPRPPS